MIRFPVFIHVFNILFFIFISFQVKAQKNKPPFPLSKEAYTAKIYIYEFQKEKLPNKSSLHGPNEKAEYKLTKRDNSSVNTRNKKLRKMMEKSGINYEIIPNDFDFDTISSSIFLIKMRRNVDMGSPTTYEKISYPDNPKLEIDELGSVTRFRFHYELVDFQTKDSYQLNTHNRWNNPFSPLKQALKSWVP